MKCRREFALKTQTVRAMSRGELESIDTWWRAANYLSIGQIYLLDNPLLREPLRPEHVKPRLLGRWGTTPRDRAPGTQRALTRVTVQRRGFLRSGCPQMSVTASRSVERCAASGGGSGSGLACEADQNATVEGLMYTWS